jgi:leucyl aminopeptidase
MPVSMEVKFVALSAARQGTTVVLAADDARLGGTAQVIDKASGGAIRRAIKAADFTGRAKATVEVLGAPDVEPRILVLGTGKDEGRDLDRLNLGGAALAAIAARKTSSASLIAEPADAGADAAAWAADLAAGALLRSYSFKAYQTKRADEEANGNGEAAKGNGFMTLYVHARDPDRAAELFKSRRAVADGVALARDLVNEPANVLGPVEFADRIKVLAATGVEVEILDVDQMRALGMGALLGVAQGSVRPARLAVMHWHGAKGGKSKKAVKPLCFVGKGVTFDTGGISIKPGAGMEDMKGDMGGAACVTGLMLALAGRNAKVDAVGLVGLVENMPSGTAQRPGDIVKSMSGQTIEVLNTDAEGRLVLADVIWYAQQRFKPRLIVDLATLTGAIMVALGKEYAGLFSNDDKLAADLVAAGEATGERVWRMPLAKAYDKLIDSKTADMKNIGGRYGGAITAAQFIQRFVKDTPWAHLDIAGTAMDSGKSEINQSWGSGWGVRLLDRLVAAHHEA